MHAAPRFCQGKENRQQPQRAHAAPQEQAGRAGASCFGLAGVGINGTARSYPRGFRLLRNHAKEDKAAGNKRFLQFMRELKRTIENDVLVDNGGAEIQREYNPVLLVRGSAVTGVKYANPALKFRRHSDIDVAVESKLLAAKLRTNERGMVHPDVVHEVYPDIDRCCRQWEKVLGRKVTVAVFLPGCLSAEPAILVKEKSDEQD